MSIAQIHRSLGLATPVFNCVVERVKLIEFAQALHLRNPIYFDRRAAIALGYRDVVASPGFVNSVTLGLREVKKEQFHLSNVAAIAGGMSWRCHATVCAGDELTGRCILARITEKAGKRPMEALEFETAVANQLGHAVMTVVETTLVFRDR